MFFCVDIVQLITRFKQGKDSSDSINKRAKNFIKRKIRSAAFRGLDRVAISYDDIANAIPQLRDSSKWHIRTTLNPTHNYIVHKHFNVQWTKEGIEVMWKNSV